MIEIRQLKYFIRIAELEHFGRAAQELHIVQPALSRQIKQLEEELGALLFDRLSRGVRLTAAGKVLLERARSIMADIERMSAATRLVAEGKTGFVRIGFADGTIYSGHLLSIIREFRKRFPNVELELVPASSVAQSEMLSRNDIDVGFVYWLPRDELTVQYRDINREKIVLAIAKTNKLSRKNSLRLKDLHGLPFIWFKRAHSPMYYDLIAKQCHRGGLSLNTVQEAFSESTMLSLVAADIGATFITEAAKQRKPNNVTLIDVLDLNATITLRAVWRKENNNPALAKLVQMVSMSLDLQ
jgi:DNA-binding transcriptional LysR family regulator